MMTQNQLTPQDLYKFATRPRYYGQKYLNTDSEEELLLVLGEACCVSAFSLVEILRLPKKGRFILVLIKTLSPQRYHSHQFLYNFPFSHFLIYVTI